MSLHQLLVSAVALGKPTDQSKIGIPDWFQWPNEAALNLFEPMVHKQHRRSLAAIAVLVFAVFALVAVAFNTPLVQLPLNFSFCAPLNNALFTIQQNSYSQTVAAIDARASDIYAKSIQSFPKLNASSLLRLACYTATHPRDNNKLSSRVKLNVLPTSYFPTISYSPDSNAMQLLRTQLKCQRKAKYKIIYVFMVHQGMDELKELYANLYDPEAFFLVHVDAKSPNMTRRTREWANNTLMSNRCNHAIMPNPFSIQWGHSSIIMAQIEAFFQMHHLFAYDYIINLSVEHLPIKSTQAIHAILNKHPGTSLMSMPDEQHPERLTMPIVPEGDELHWWLYESQRTWPFHMPVIKHSQWLVLSHAFVSQLLLNPLARSMLAFCEHAMIPDEMYFSTFGLAEVSGGVRRGQPTYFHFKPGEWHPEWLNLTQARTIKDPDVLFIRKVRLNETDLRLWAQSERRRVNLQLGIV